MQRTHKTVIRMLHAVAAMILASAATAQSAATYPSKPIRMIIPFAPGGGVDITGRTVAGDLSKAWGQPVVADNQAGAGGALGLALGGKAAPDGHTLIIISASLLVNQYTQPNVSYDLLRDFSPLSQLSRQPNALVISPAVPAKNVKEFIAYAKANPGKLNYGSTGVGSTPHLSSALFAQMAGIEMTHVPYKGGAQAIQDVIVGNIQLCSCTLLLAGPHMKSGKVRVLAVSTAQRAAGAPDIPTIAESGVPGYDVSSWHGLLLPLKTPQPIVAKLNQEIARIMQSPDVAPKLAADGSQAVGGTPEEFTAMLKSEGAKWAKLAKEIGLKAD